MIKALACLTLFSLYPVFAQPAPAPKPLFRDPIYDGAADPSLIYNRATKKWLMFYTNRRASQPNLPAVTWLHGTRIGIAESADGGNTWTYDGTVQLDYGKPDYTHWAPELFAHRGVFHMYLSIVPGIFRDWNAPRQIVHFTSRDLRKWKFESALDLGSDRVIDACVIQLPDGKFRMWFKDERAKDGSLHYADSPDLYHWTAKGVAIPGVNGEGPKVFKWKDQYWLIADVWKGFAVFRSTDCLKWERQPDNILAEPGTQPTDRAQGNHADIVVSAGRAYIFYFTHQRGADAQGKDPDWNKRTVIQVAELKEAGGIITCDRNQPVHVELRPPVRP
jgi:beta-xylosidase